MSSTAEWSIPAPYQDITKKIEKLRRDVTSLTSKLNEDTLKVSTMFETWRQEYNEEGQISVELGKIYNGVQILEMKVKAANASYKDVTTLYLAEVCYRFQNAISSYVMHGTTSYKKFTIKELPTIEVINRKQNDLTSQQLPRWTEICKKWGWPLEVWTRKTIPIEVGCLINLLRKRVDVAHPAIDIELAGLLYDEERRDPTLEHYDQILQKYKELLSSNWDKKTRINVHVNFQSNTV